MQRAETPTNRMIISCHPKANREAVKQLIINLTKKSRAILYNRTQKRNITEAKRRLLMQEHPHNFQDQYSLKTDLK